MVKGHDPAWKYFIPIEGTEIAQYAIIVVW